MRAPLLSLFTRSFCPFHWVRSARRRCPCCHTRRHTRRHSRRHSRPIPGDAWDAWRWRYVSRFVSVSPCHIHPLGAWLGWLPATRAEGARIQTRNTAACYPSQDRPAVPPPALLRWTTRAPRPGSLPACLRCLVRKTTSDCLVGCGVCLGGGGGFGRLLWSVTCSDFPAACRLARHGCVSGCGCPGGKRRFDPRRRARPSPPLSAPHSC